jgi:rare lipoprotein A
MKLITVSVICFFLLFSVFGQENSASFRQEGIASWYGVEFAGRPTASGEIFNPSDMTAAHPNLPFGTFLRVTNTHNGKQVIVRVNDRGPFAAARIIDLSEQAAGQLDMIVTGTAPVIVEKINVLPQNNDAPQSNSENVAAVPAQNQTELYMEHSSNVTIETYDNISKTELPIQTENISASIQQIQRNEISPSIKVHPGIPPANSGKSYRIQVGSYKNAKNAVDAFDVLKNAGLTPAYERYNDLYRVVLAQIQSNNVQSVIDTLAKSGFQEVLIKEEL